ncbi:LysR family transcriptional regulator [Sphingobium sp. BHU LFT2]|uniref:LysR substrate-binding domain-containing protein n=1 Tax=Sphingobium sp. BHU LFT2 TaxID=2807634 RepID=UPI001BE9C02A|nr:LysR substrate-binding domain-containing protein [Sphingobium sp. BHU LFT2]MBT2245852.1 LysR family transcriptional regulator [Sphingobium sp. BHU LFT2]
MKGLHALSKLARAGSLTAAATELGVTRSAISHRIADLEGQLGVRLLRKAGRSSGLTDDAEALLAAMGDAIERIEAAVEPLHQRRMQIRLSTVATFASHWLLPRISGFQARHPDIMLAISTTRRTVDLDNEAFDCAIRHGLGEWEGFSTTLLFRETLVPIAIPTITDIESATIIRARSRYRDWPTWWSRSGRPGKPSGEGLIVETRAQALDAALSGAGIAMMDLAYVQGHLTAGRLQSLADPIQLSEGYYFVHRTPPRNERLISALRDWLMEQAQQ